MVLSAVHPSSPLLENVLDHLVGVRSSRRGWVACCPAHADREPSLSIALGEQGQVLLKCFASCSVERIVEAMGLTLVDLFPPGSSAGERASSNGAHHVTLTLLDLAVEKQLPWRFLLHLGVTELPTGGLHIPYHLPDGTPAPRSRIRTALIARQGSRWSKGPGQIVPYGLERLADARKAGYLVLVEGESDCWTLWYQGFPALGLPGAEMAGTLELSMLSGIDRLYLVQEPDAAGATFVTSIADHLKGWRWQGKAAVVHLPDAKDPNELYKHDRKGFRTAFQQALDAAQPLVLTPSEPGECSGATKPRVFSLKELLSWDLPPMRWAIPGILPEGLTLLAGKPKQGKSWLALSAALSIAAGGVALGTQQVIQGEVLYLALEDNARRLQARGRQLLSSLSRVPDGMEFALDWPRLGEGGLALLEEYLKAHPRLRLVVIDTWARVAPQTGKRRNSQYEGDYEALIPLKQLADTYRVSIVAVHHLRKTGSSDVLDEITGSIGMTGAVDGTLILKRERGQTEATLFVTGRDIEREQHLALSFDTPTALWSVIGNAEEVGRSRARQQMLDLLHEQPEGMSPREVAEALEKNYHTTRSLLRKMEETGEVMQRYGKYLALAGNDSRERTPATDVITHGEHSQRREQAVSDHEGLRGNAGAPQHDATDYADYVDYNTDILAGPVDYADDTDYSKGACAASHTREHPLDEGNIQQPGTEASPLCEQVMLLQEDRHQQEAAITNVITRNQRNQCHQLTTSEPLTEENQALREAEQAAQGEPGGTSAQTQHCPHHPRARLVRFDPAGQAWCDHLECWSCYRLMKIGEALSYRCLPERGGKLLITEGREVWATYVRTQRAFLVTWAVQEAVALCRALGIPEPELWNEVPRLIEVQPLPP